ncbi:hypothetical protein MSAN_00261500 [Mycena sanguinolenta]|uniref:BTB domain-containing protein n=1 Tax=Mycena sanguinolenta TaxID=230812 RepID=A0A8H7DK56_9AGAR|nr:hypothetical protein MSAN_00261500 [Mycena sanguinolenta]
MNPHRESPSPHSPSSILLDRPTLSSERPMVSTFYVQLAILSLVSPVFETMFTLPQAEDSSQIYPVIDVQEASPALDRALRFFYPCTQLTVDSLDELKEVIEILISKYDMQWLVPSVKKHLERYVTSDPITVYAYAYVHGWEDLGRAAAKETLKLPLRTPGENTPEVLRLIPADAYYKLLRYHYCCGIAAQTTTVDLGWISWPDSSTAEYRWFHCWRDWCAVYNSRGPIIVANETRAARQWFMDYFVGMGDILATTPAADVRGSGAPAFHQDDRQSKRVRGLPGSCIESSLPLHRAMGRQDSDGYSGSRVEILAATWEGDSRLHKRITNSSALLNFSFVVRTRIPFKLISVKISIFVIDAPYCASLGQRH